MIARFLFNRPRMLLLAVGVILVAGLSAVYMLPRMEDPVLGKRVGLVITAFPGAGAERVESLVTARLEDALRDIAEVKQLQSNSRAGISSVVIELRDEVVDVDPVWSRVSDRLEQAAAELPSGALQPEFERMPLKACAAIVALKWQRSEPVNFAILQKLAERLRLRLLSLESTEDVQLYGSQKEEVLVDFTADTLASLGLPIGQAAEQLRDSDAKLPAGLFRGPRSQLILDLNAGGDSLTRLGETQIRYGGDGQFVRLGDIASITKATVDPPQRRALCDGVPALVVAALVRDTARIDHWSTRMQAALREFERSLPPGIVCDLLFSQSRYVEQRLGSLLRNLVLGTAAVVLVVFVLMGWRSTIIMATALPLSALMVLIGMRALGIPIHQMSITGLIIALGLLIDNVIVVVDEVRSRIWSGMTPLDAVRQGVRHLAMPLFGSTLTTTLAFAPIALLPGPPGEFVGSIAVSVILAINSSFLLAMTVVPAITALIQPPMPDGGRRRSLLGYGFSNRQLLAVYQGSLSLVYRFPWLGVLLGSALPLLGFVGAMSLPEQFFPASDRNQIQVELELNAAATLDETRAVAEKLRALILDDADTTRVHWFSGESAPTFFYNVVPRRRNTPFYGQAMVELRPGADPRTVTRRLQALLASQQAEARVLVRQLEQGPPFDAPIEIRLQGPDLATLQRIGSRLRLLLSQSPQVVATRSDLEETQPKLEVGVDKQASLLAGLRQGDIARQLYSSLEGLDGGTLLEGTQELPIRVRVADNSRRRLDQLGSLGLIAPPRPGPPEMPMGPRGMIGRRGPPLAFGPPLAAIAELGLDSEVATIQHVDGQRVNEVKAYLVAGVLPAVVIADFERRLADADFSLPVGYAMQYGGEAEKRDEAVGNLIASGAVLFSLMLVTLVLSFGSFRIALIIASVGGLSMGLGAGALAFFQFPFGFMAIVGTMGLVGVAINDAIVVMAAIRSNPQARAGDLPALRGVVVGATRHVVATTFTTIVGFLPLLLAGGRFWPPLAVTIAGGVGGATLLALYLVPSLYLLLLCRGTKAS